MGESWVENRTITPKGKQHFPQMTKRSCCKITLLWSACVKSRSTAPWLMAPISMQNGPSDLFHLTSHRLSAKSLWKIENLCQFGDLFRWRGRSQHPSRCYRYDKWFFILIIFVLPLNPREAKRSKRFCFATIFCLCGCRSFRLLSRGVGRSYDAKLGPNKKPQVIDIDLEKPSAMHDGTDFDRHQ